MKNICYTHAFSIGIPRLYGRNNQWRVYELVSVFTYVTVMRECVCFGFFFLHGGRFDLKRNREE